MLVLSRKKGESLMIGENIEIRVLAVEADIVKIGIIAPRHVEVLRKELVDSIREANLQSMSGQPVPAELSDLLKKMNKP
jgi:carbon storage regulator